MASGALFGSSASRSQSKNLVEFRAGKMSQKGKMVHPDKRKGSVYVYQSDDSLIHFCWKDRTTGIVEDEPKADKDEENCKKLNDFINNPPSGSSRSGAGFGSELGSALGDNDLQSFLGGMSQQQLMQLLGGMGGLGALTGPGSGSGSSGRQSSATSQSSTTTASTTAATTAAPTTSTTASTAAQETTAAASTTNDTTTTTASNSASATATVVTTTTTTSSSSSSSAEAAPIQLSDLQNILAGIQVPLMPERTNVDLSSTMTAESMGLILSDPGFQRQLMPLMPHGSELPQTIDELRRTIQSPQFQQALSTFSVALQSGQLGPLMSQFQLGESVTTAAAQGDVEAFVRALQATQGGVGSKEDKSEEKKESDSSKKKDDDSDDEMALD
ncbi:PREDICTED: proteasomal ubiquitin receptor ADRM1-like isoform X2 [Priapulus caudatus]|uniref:Proteasomal ubiquitin receptor ADRM1-like isoform X2 n=1 Tax=Priapulus caudatus TaxID=37621 RepID=A0ABM1F9B5_PRICU|nr:PREDICTED: proteasomal ubiquitin receptor ADRM1-like isoform X2 [Priapulus caudatus]